MSDEAHALIGALARLRDLERALDGGSEASRALAPDDPYLLALVGLVALLRRVEAAVPRGAPAAAEPEGAPERILR